MVPSMLAQRRTIVRRGGRRSSWAARMSWRPGGVKLAALAALRRPAAPVELYSIIDWSLSHVHS
eukprot:scaffold160063_cov52-Prasinocladus_malaysianus.AAC.1